MAFKKAVLLNADRIQELKKPGESVEGYYLGYKTTETRMGVAKIHIFLTAEGTVGTWGAARLDALLAQIEAKSPGSLTNVTYKGKVNLSGGRTAKDYDVVYDAELTSDVPVATAEESADAEDTSDVMDEADAYLNDAEEEVQEEAPPARPMTRGKPATFNKAHAAGIASRLKK